MAPGLQKPLNKRLGIYRDRCRLSTYVGSAAPYNRLRLKTPRLFLFTAFERPDTTETQVSVVWFNQRREFI